MSDITNTLPTHTELAAQPANAIVAYVDGLKKNPVRRLIVGGMTLLVLLSLVRVIADANSLTSSGTMGTTLRVTIPLLLAGLAGLWAERVGILNIGIEGMMIFGTWFGGYGAWKFGAWTGLLLGVVGGALGALIHAVATIRFHIDQVISGIAMNLLALNLMRYLSEIAFVGHQGGGITQSPPQSSKIPTFSVPFLAGGNIFGWKSPDLLGWLEDHHWFLIGDAAGLLRGLVHGVSWASAIGLLLVPVSAFVLWRTRFGLRLRSSGEAPAAAESLGVRIVRIRYAGVLLSGAFAGLAGAYLSIVSFSYYRQGQTAGRGYIGIATMIIGNWRPVGVLGGALLFGFFEALQLVGRDSVHGLMLFTTFVAGLAMILSIARRKLVPTITAIVVGVLFLIAYITVNKVPESLVLSLPYLATLIVLATASQRLRPPAMAGVPYRPGSAH